MRWHLCAGSILNEHDHRGGGTMATSRFLNQGPDGIDVRAKINGALEAADVLAKDGRWREALDVLNSANRVQRDREVERRLLSLRHNAFEHLERNSPPPWPPSVSARVPSGSPPEVASVDLNPGVFTNSILGLARCSCAG